MELISVHIPKAAGTAFRSVLEQYYPPGEVLRDYADRVLDPAALFRSDFCRWRSAHLETMRVKPVAARCVHGHFWLGKWATCFPGARRVIWLREPIQRVISHYFFWKSRARTEHSLQKRLLDEDLSLLEFAALPELRNIVAQTFIRGYDLSDFDFVGRMERFDEDLGAFMRIMEWQNPVEHPLATNQTTANEYRQFRADWQTLRKIAELNEADMELYSRAVARN